ncbi:MAG: hypothetical protein ACI9S8_002599 [Chlamydiales bacterium]|jgi:hypothetical protein
MYTKRIIAVSIGTIISYSTYGITWGMNDITSVMRQNTHARPSHFETSKVLDTLHSTISTRTKELGEMIRNGNLKGIPVISQHLDQDISTYADYLKGSIDFKYHNQIDDLKLYSMESIGELKEYSENRELTNSQKSIIKIQVYWKELGKLHKESPA